MTASDTEPFAHGVASGDPLEDRVVIWTRVSPPGPGDADVGWIVAMDPALSDPVASGTARADAESTVLHLGDYIYEAAQKPAGSQTPAADIGREVDPPHECVSLADYRRRYAHYHLDPQLQALHAAHPLIATLDDHELADGAWRGGSVEHQVDRDGAWAHRRAHAFRARWEWLPTRRPVPEEPERVFRAVHIGGIADLFLIDTRSRRDEPVPPPDMHDPGRSAPGSRAARLAGRAAGGLHRHLATPRQPVSAGSCLE